MKSMGRRSAIKELAEYRSAKFSLSQVSQFFMQMLYQRSNLIHKVISPHPMKATF
jgi:hypothetical protein